MAHPEANIQWQGASRIEDVRVSADPIQIQQVTFNLLKNAIDVHNAAGRAREPITVRIAREAGACRVEVRDRCGRLTEEQAGHLFEPFFTTKKEGLGLGLTLGKWIIEAHGGMEVQQMLKERAIRLPVIFLSAHGDLPMAVLGLA